METTAFNEERRNAFANQIEKITAHISALQSVALDNVPTAEETASLQDAPMMQEYMELPFNHPKEKAMKKLFAAAVALGTNTDVLPFSLQDNSPVAIASAVDEGLTRIKTAAQTAIGNLDVIEATDILIDNAAARTRVILEKVVEKGMPLALQSIQIAVIRAFPPAKILAPIVQHAEKYVTPVAKQMVKKGIHTIATAAKVAIRTVVASAKKVTNKIFNFLKA